MPALLSLLCAVPIGVRAEWKLIDFTDEAAFYIDDFFEPGQKARVWEMIDYREPFYLSQRSHALAASASYACRTEGGISLGMTGTCVTWSPWAR